jgi:glucosamine--fructose-6-phosphate aminotransferase (isomerizing)
MSNSDRKYRIIAGEYQRDILDQPRALEATLAGLTTADGLLPIVGQLKQGILKRVVLTGMGSSFYALCPLYLRLSSRGCATWWVETSELVHHIPQLLDPATLIIAVSQSGESAEILTLLAKNAGRARIIAVTNTEKSSLASAADAVVLTSAGEEFSVSCKTYVTALMALGQVAAILSSTDLGQARSELAQAAPAAAAYLNSWREHVLELAAALDGVDNLFLVGRGISLAAVGTGALITKESTHYHAEGMSSAAFRHGPMEMASEKTFVGVFSGVETTRALNAKLVDDVRRKGGRAELIGTESRIASLRIPPVPESVMPILEILPAEMMTLALAAQTGREAGRFSFASKVTTIE